MVDKTIETGNHDDGADLVKEVLEQNPPEEAGIREEWDKHVGWHRQENIRGGHGNGRANHKVGASLLRGSDSNPSEQVKHDPQNKPHNSLISDANDNKDTNHDGFPFTGIMNPFYIGGVIFVVLALLVRLTHSRLRLSRGQKER